ncbi:MAG: hypothetical protein ACQERT_00935 [Thermodesulfobacteriota bacterium]
MAGEDVYTGPEIVPEWMQVYQQSEEDFAAAYAFAQARERAFVKTAMAGLYAWLRPSQVTGRKTETELAQGLTICEVKSPRKWAVVHMPSSCAGPGLILAAFLPLLAAGVWPVIAVLGEKSPGRQAALLTLELAGIDTAFILPEEMMASALRYWQNMRGRSPGLLAHVGQEPALSCTSGGPLFISLPQPQKAAVWMGDEDFDVQALSFAHPGMEFVVWSEHKMDLPPDWSQDRGKWSQFLDQEADVVWVPNSRLHQALEVYSLVLGPGQEPLWIWPWYTPNLFEYTRLGLVWNT